MDKIFWFLLHKYCSECTIAGLKYFFRYTGFLSRCFWTLNSIILLVLACQISWSLYASYHLIPTRVNVDNRFEPIYNLPHPTITLCSPNQMTLSAMDFFNQSLVNSNLTMVDLKSILPIFLDFYEPVNESYDTKVKQLQDSFELNRFTISEIMGKSALSCERFLKRCYLEEQWLDCKSLFKPILTAYGYCCAFNSKYYFNGRRNMVDRDFETKTINKTGIFSFLTLITDYESEDALPGTLINSGATRVTLTDSTEFPVDYKTFLVEPNSEAYVLLTATYTSCSDGVQLLPVPSRSCYFEHERFLRYFKEYHNSDCNLLCYATAVYKNCKCWLYFLPTAGSDEFCKVTHIPCLIEVKKNTNWLSTENCHCLKDCVSRRYNADLSIGNLLSIPYMIEAHSPYQGLKINKSTTVMHFMFLRPIYTKMIRETLSSLPVFVPMFGGIFSFFTGCSTISIFELQSLMTTDDKIMKKHFWVLLRKYCLESSLPGLKYFYQYPDKVSRCFWSLNLAVSLTISGLMTFWLYSRFLEMPTRITLENRYQSIRNLPYPTITLCSPTQLSVSGFNYFNRTLVEPAPGELGVDLKTVLPQMMNLYIGFNNDRLDVENLSRLQYILDLNRFTIPELMEKVPQSCEKFLKACMFEGKEYNCSDLFQPIITALGYCCVFNSKYYYKDKRIITNPHFKEHKVRGTGHEYGLTVVTDYEPDDVLDNALYFSGATRVYLSDVTEFPRHYESAPVDTGGEAVFSLYATVTYCSDEVKSLAPWGRGCNFEDEQNVTFFTAYRNSDCLHSCIVEAVFKVCNCVLAYVPNVKDQNICKLTDIACVKNIPKIKTMIIKSKACSCPRDCLSRRYKMELTIGNLNAIPYMRDSALPIKKMNLSESSSIFIFMFGTPTYMIMKQETVISIVNMISNLGGVFGLFLGCSGISLLEIAFYIYRGFKLHSASKRQYCSKKGRAIVRDSGATEIMVRDVPSGVQEINSSSYYGPVAYFPRRHFARHSFDRQKYDTQN